MKELFNISKFDCYREDNRREVKKAKSGLPVSLWESYSSFANTYGGVIILGIKESNDKSWKTTGLKFQDKDKLLDEFWSLINNHKKVSINLLTENNVNVFEVNNDIIIVIDVPMAKREERPVYVNDNLFSGTFRRNHSGDFHCTEEQVKAMLRDQTETTVDMNIVNGMTIENLDIESLHNYRNRHRAFKLAHPWIDLSDEVYLQKIGAAEMADNGIVYLTAAGLLMFGEENRIVRHFPEYFLDYRETLDTMIRWSDRLQSSSGEWSGNLFDFYFRVFNKIIRNVKVPFKLVGGDRVDDTPVHRALREVLANCLVNTDFFVPRGIVIKQRSDTLSFENPGTIRVGKHQMKCGGQSDPRNKALMKMFNLIGIGERAGSGVPELFSVWDKEGWKEPIIEEQFNPDRTVLLIEFKKKSDSKKATVKSDSKKATVKSDSSKITRRTKEQCNKLLHFMEKGVWYKVSECIEVLDVKETRTKELLKLLVQDGKVEENGRIKGRSYKKL